jgi:hypothetical protein
LNLCVVAYTFFPCILPSPSTESRGYLNNTCLEEEWQTFQPGHLCAGWLGDLWKYAQPDRNQTKGQGVNQKGKSYNCLCVRIFGECESQFSVIFNFILMSSRVGNWIIFRNNIELWYFQEKNSIYVQSLNKSFL